MMRQWVWCIFLSLAAVLCLTAPSFAGPDDKVIRMFLPDTDWPPYLIDDPRYPGGGVLLEVMKGVAEPMGYEIKVERLPDKRGWYLLEKGDVDVHAKAQVWVTDPDRFLWTEPFMEHEGVLLYPVESRIRFTGNKSLYGQRVVAIQGFIYPAFEQDFQSGRIIRVDVTCPYAMLELLARGRADAALVNRSETLWLFANRPELQPERFRMEDKPYDSAGYRYVFTKEDRWKPFIRVFDRRIREMKADGQLDAILDKYR